MSPPATGTAPGPDQLFVIACPVCRGQMAATGRLCGRDACCPLCANLFRVPLAAPSAAAPGPPAGSSLAEDWGGVIEQLASPAGNAGASPRHEEPPPPPEFTLAAERSEAASLSPEPAAETPPASAPPSEPPPFDGPEPTATPAEPGPLAAGSEAAPFVPSEEPAPVVSFGLEDALTPAAPVDTAALPRTEPAALDPSASELVFHEPVRTIRQRGTVVEIRRLTPEERRARRFRRNLMMIVVGVSILMVIVLLFGVPNVPRK